MWRLFYNVKTDQLPHTHFDNPRDIWTNLEKIHCTHGFVTHLLLQQCFLCMTKDAAKPMIHWIVAVKQVAYQLTKISGNAPMKTLLLSPLGLPTLHDKFRCHHSLCSLPLSSGSLAWLHPLSCRGNIAATTNVSTKPWGAVLSSPG